MWIGFVLVMPLALAACLLSVPAWLAAVAFGALLASTVGRTGKRLNASPTA